MEYLLALLGLAGFAYYQYSKRKDAETDALLAKTKGKDEVLEAEQLDVEEEIEKIDSAIAEMNKKREKKNPNTLTLKERADKWKKR